MRHLFILLFSVPCALLAQRNKELQFRVGTGIAGYATMSDYTLKFGNAEYQFKDTSGAATRQLHLGVRYEVHHRIALGLDFRRGNYIYDPEEDNKGKENSFGMFGLTAELNMISRPQFRWNLGLGFHGARLTITEPLLEGVPEDKGTSEWRGSGISLQTGIIAYISKSPIGLTFDLGYDGNSFTLENYAIDGEDQDLSGWEASFDAKGFLVQVGVIFRIGASQ